MDYLVYFAGPLLLGVFGVRHLWQHFRVSSICFPAFILAWVVMQTAATSPLMLPGRIRD